MLLKSNPGRELWEKDILPFNLKIGFNFRNTERVEKSKTNYENFKSVYFFKYLYPTF